LAIVVVTFGCSFVIGLVVVGVGVTDGFGVGVTDGFGLGVGVGVASFSHLAVSVDVC
jgi:hypothetical protein